MARTAIDSAKQTHLLAAATHEFAQNGYANGSTDAIAAAAGVSKGTLFNYFGSKAKLYVAAVQAAIDKINGVADLSVWQDAPDFTTMIKNALQYKIGLQIQYPDEFALSIAAYGELAQLPAKQAAALKAFWAKEVTTYTPELIGPVLERLHLRPGVKQDTVMALFGAMSDLITQRSKVFLQAHPDATVAEMSPLVDDAMAYIDVLAHGFEAES